MSRKLEANPCDFERTLLYILFNNASRISYRVPKHIFSREGGGGGGGRGRGRGALITTFELGRGANSKRGAYLKLGANSSIYGVLISGSPIKRPYCSKAN